MAASESWTSKLELGTIGEWISGLATAGAPIGTLLVLGKDKTALSQQAAEQQRAAAARIAAQKSTDEQLALALEQAQISRDTLRTGLRPFLVDIPVDMFPGRQDIGSDDGRATYVNDAATIYGPRSADPPARGLLSVSARNIGKGAR